MNNPGDPLVTTLPEYRKFIEDLKTRVVSARISATRAVNRDLILLYWDIGRGIVEKQKTLGWGESVIEQISRDLKEAFPATKGFSLRNLWYMKQLYSAYSDEEIWQRVVAKLPSTGVPGTGKIWQQAVAKIAGGEKPTEFLQWLVAEIHWGHNLLILHKLKDPSARLYYLLATARFGWTYPVLLNQIKAGTYEHAVTEKKTHNFPLVLPEDLADQADEMMKSTYNLEFLGIRREVRERELEERLLSRLQAFLLELGYGFCFVGRQHRLALGEKEYFIDLLLYQRFIRSLVAFDLKIGPFAPEYAGKMDFYLNLLNDKERGEGDQPSIGIILCAEKDDVEVEYALRTKTNPIGVAAYQLQPELPSDMRGKLPTARQLADVVRAVVPAPGKGWV